MNFRHIVTVALFIIPAALSASRLDADTRPPNIVFILADDFGVGDIQALYPENKIATPNLDRLTREGMSFTDAHSGSAVCSPTRYGLLTGRYAWRTRLQEWVLASYEPPLIDANRLTLPAFLKQHGYHTACFGKWHLGWDWPGEQPSETREEKHALRHAAWDFTQPVRGGPIERGFDEFFGVDLPNFPPFTFIANDRVNPLPTARYQTDPKNRYSVGKVFGDTPMAPGWQFQSILPTITERAVKYIERHAKDDAPFFLYFAQTSPHEPVAPSEKFAGKSGIAPIADFIMETDWSAGEVIKAIDDAGIAENTIVIFATDNGHSHYTGMDILERAGHKVSGPYRGHKGDIWEGGHRVPFIVRWPGHVPAGSSNDSLLCLNDVFATCAEILNTELPKDAAGDSFSFVPVLRGEAASGGRANLVNHSVHGEFAYREGPWKLVFKMPTDQLETSRGKPAVVQLYNLSDDVAEQKDVAKLHPEVVESLRANLQKVVDDGRSNSGPRLPNDAAVRFDVMQTERWAPALQ